MTVNSSFADVFVVNLRLLTLQVSAGPMATERVGIARKPCTWELPEVCCYLVASPPRAKPLQLALLL